MATLESALAEADKVGAANANDHSVCAMYAETLAGRYCCDAEAVWEWLQKHYGDEWEQVEFALHRGADFLGAFLSDEPLNEDA